MQKKQFLLNKLTLYKLITEYTSKRLDVLRFQQILYLNITANKLHKHLLNKHLKTV